MLSYIIWGLLFFVTRYVFNKDLTSLVFKFMFGFFLLLYEMCTRFQSSPISFSLNLKVQKVSTHCGFYGD